MQIVKFIPNKYLKLQRWKEHPCKNDMKVLEAGELCTNIQTYGIIVHEVYSLVIAVVFCLLLWEQALKESILQLSAWWPGLWMVVRLELTLLWIHTSLLLIYLICNKAVRSVSKQGSPPASLPLKGQVTEQTTVKWSFLLPHYQKHFMISNFPF